jgi:hypothetical protein
VLNELAGLKIGRVHPAAKTSDTLVEKGVGLGTKLG